MNRLTETNLEREVRISFAYIDHITNEACKKLDLLKKDYEPKEVRRNTGFGVNALKNCSAARNVCVVSGQ